MIWGGTVGAVWDFGKNTYKALTGDFEDMNWDNSYGNIKGGWNRLYSAGQHMNETGAMHDTYLLEEAEKKIKQQSEAAEYRRLNQGKPGVPVEKDFVIPGSQPLGISTSIPNFNTTVNNNYNSTVKDYKKNNEAIKVELPTNINEAINKWNEAKITKALDSKTIDEVKKTVKPDVTINSNPTYNASFTINEATDGKKVKNIVDTCLRNQKTQEEQKIKAQIGMNYGYY